MRKRFRNMTRRKIHRPLDPGFAPLYESCKIRFKFVCTSMNPMEKWVPMVELHTDMLTQRVHLDQTNGPAVYGLALRVHHAERQARRDAARIAALERELAAERASRAQAGFQEFWRTHINLGCTSKEVRTPIGEGWLIKRNQAGRLVAIQECDDADSVEDRRRA